MGVKGVLSQCGDRVEMVGEAANGQAAADFLQNANNDVDLVLSDVKMPVMDGIELAKWMDETGQKARIVMLSAHDDYDYVREAFLYGAIDYLLKHEISEKTILELLDRIPAVAPSDAREKDAADIPPEASDTVLSGDVSLYSGKRPHHIIRQCLDYIRSNYFDEGLSLQKIGELTGYTGSYLSRLFKQETGRNLVDYINEVRIENAKRMFAGDRVKACHVSEAVGYNNYSYFCRVFKKVTGVSPSAYIAEMQSDSRG
jgi:YesN/AraC family two-component response regulator